MKPLLVCASLAIGFALAQENPPDPRTQQSQEQSSSTDEPQPSELSDSGPSVLGHDKRADKRRSGQLLNFRFYAEITGVYDSGLTPVGPNAPSGAASTADAGFETGLGLAIDRNWQHDQLSVEYRGHFREYAKDTLFNGTDQFLNLSYSHEIDRHLAVRLEEIGGTTTLANGAFAYLPLPTSDLALPTNELFDNRTDYLESRASLIWDKTARLSFDVGGEGFLVRRDSLALAGLDGYIAHAGAAYRITRRQTLSAIYKYTSFDFQRVFGDAALETAQLGYSVALSRSLNLAIQAGGTHVDARGLTQVTIDPSIAAIIGQNVATVTFSHSIYIPELEAQLVQRFRRASLRLHASDGVSPGNGVYLTSRQSAVAMGYSYTGYRRLTMMANAGYSQLSTIGQNLGKYTNVAAGAAMTYEIARGTHLEMRYDYRHYTTQSSFSKMNSNRVTLGLAYSPGETPLSVW